VAIPLLQQVSVHVHSQLPFMLQFNSELNKIMVMGGYAFWQQQPCMYFSSIEVINLEDPSNHCQPIIDSLPVTIGNGAAILYNDEVMVCGGEKCNYVFFACYILNSQNGIWSPGPLMAAPKAGFASSFAGEDWIITGGVPENPPSAQVFNGNAFQGIDKPQLVMPNDHCQVTIDEETIFLAGGENFFLYNFVTGDLETIDAALNVAHEEYGLNCGLVINGNGEKEVVAIQREESAILSLSSKKWRLGPHSPELYGVVATVQLEDTFIMIGGNVAHPIYEAADTIYIFNTTTYEIDLMEQRLQKGREMAMAVAVPDEFVTCEE